MDNNKEKQLGRNSVIDIIKGICILLVIITHYQWTNEQRLKLLFPFWIDMAVPLFMIFSGYLSALSFQKRNFNMTDWYSLSSLFSKLFRFVIPFSIAYFIEVIVEVFVLKRFTLFQIFASYFVGGYGPGGYYFPLMIQFVFLFPFICYVIKKYDFYGLLLMFCINGIYEFLQRIYGMNIELYRLLIFRYVFVISFGVFAYLCREKKIKKKWGLLSFLIGLFFIVLVEYTEYIPKILIYWTRTSFLACLYILPFSYFILKLKSKIKFTPLQILGKASFNIFLTQMVYYQYMSSVVKIYVENDYICLLLNVCLCVIVGILFYFIESPLTKKIISSLTNKKVYIAYTKINNFFWR